MYSSIHTEFQADLPNLYSVVTQLFRPLLIVGIGEHFPAAIFTENLQKQGFGQLVVLDTQNENSVEFSSITSNLPIHYYSKQTLTESVFNQEIKQKIDLLVFGKIHTIAELFELFNRYYSELRVGGGIILHAIYPAMSQTESGRCLIDHLKAHQLIPNVIELLELPTTDGMGIAILRKLTDSPVKLPLPQAQRWKRLLQKIQGQSPWWTRIPLTPAHQSYQIQVTIKEEKSELAIANARLHCHGKTYLSDSQGQIVLNHYLPNRYLMCVEAEGYCQQEKTVVDLPAVPAQKKRLHIPYLKTQTIFLKKYLTLA